MVEYVDAGRASSPSPDIPTATWQLQTGPRVCTPVLLAGLQRLEQISIEGANDQLDGLASQLAIELCSCPDR